MLARCHIIITVQSLYLNGRMQYSFHLHLVLVYIAIQTQPVVMSKNPLHHSLILWVQWCWHYASLNLLSSAVWTCSLTWAAPVKPPMKELGCPINGCQSVHIGCRLYKFYESSLRGGRSPNSALYLASPHLTCAGPPHRGLHVTSRTIPDIHTSKLK